MKSWGPQLSSHLVLLVPKFCHLVLEGQRLYLPLSHRDLQGLEAGVWAVEWASVKLEKGQKDVIWEYSYSEPPSLPKGTQLLLPPQQ